MIKMVFWKDHSDFSVKNKLGILRQSTNGTQGMLVRKPVTLATVDGGKAQNNGSKVREGYGMTELRQMGVCITIYP